MCGGCKPLTTNWRTTLSTPVWDTLRVSHSLVCLEGGAKEPSVDDFLLRADKELRCPPTGTGTDSGEATAATWLWFSAMHEAIGGRPSIEPPILIDSCEAEVTGSSAVSNEPGLSPSASVEEREEDSTTSAPSGTGNFHKETPCTSSGTPPTKKKRTNRVQDFLETETEKEEERFQATHKLMQSTSNRFLDLFEQLIKKS
ncbi:hypothetical protein E1301_Tti018117 [Triplophysa tibetana]|uniref:Uncharacterized protein n=1 Tax=Triplophysa tibetana TaxID=1572043 RepID=A0A5A9PGQ9_9TELE|nr:hypothetical protein E1301_Tti018117 [Triplophysa tibetana]